MQHDFGGGGHVAGHYCAKSIGAPFKVYLANGVETAIDPSSGKSVTSITDLPGLIAAVVRRRVMHSRKLTGAELKFIRSALRLKANKIADKLDLTPEHYSRCESGQRIMSTTTEKVYRCFVFFVTFLRDENLRKAVREQEQAKQIPPEEAQKALEEFQKLFFDMKISPIFNAGEELEFVFSRGCPNEQPCGEDDAKWKFEEPELDAA